MSETPAAECQTDFRQRWIAMAGHRDRLRRIAMRRVNSVEDAEDCVHDAMIRCVTYADLDVSRAGALLTTVVMNSCTDLHRRRGRRDRAVHRLRATCTDRETFDEEICDRDLAADLEKTLVQLSERERDVVRLRTSGLSVQETAEALGVSYRSVTSALTRARRRLTDVLED